MSTISSPILRRAAYDPSVWVSRDSKSAAQWLCVGRASEDWELSEAREIQLVASDRKVRGAQEVTVLQFAEGVATLEHAAMPTYAAFHRWLRRVEKAFGKSTFWGWIEIVS
jgi:hypothetical protein